MSATPTPAHKRHPLACRECGRPPAYHAVCWTPEERAETGRRQRRYLEGPDAKSLAVYFLKDRGDG